MKTIDFGDKKQEFKLSNGNVLLIDTSDIKIATRMREALGDMSEFASLAAEINGSDMAVISEMHEKMCEKIDYIFGEGVAAACCAQKNMFDIIGGEFRYEKIIAKLSEICATELEKSAKALKKRVVSAAAKYKNV